MRLIVYVAIVVYYVFFLFPLPPPVYDKKAGERERERKEMLISFFWLVPR